MGALLQASVVLRVVGCGCFCEWELELLVGRLGCEEGIASPMVPAVLTPSGAVDLGTLMLRNQIIFVGSLVNTKVLICEVLLRQVAQSVISKLSTLAAINDEEFGKTEELS